MQPRSRPRGFEERLQRCAPSRQGLVQQHLALVQHDDAGGDFADEVEVVLELDTAKDQWSIAAGTYSDCAAWKANDLTIEGASPDATVITGAPCARIASPV